MASDTATGDLFTADAAQDDITPGYVLMRILEPLASLKLTVVLFALSIAIVLFGTLAQHHKDIWLVVDEYFRCYVAQVEFADLLVPAFFVGGQVPFDVDSWPVKGFYFPGGWLIGGLMAVNLLSAHGIRFKPQAKGARLLGGAMLIGVGALLTYVVIVSGANKEGLQHATWLQWDQLWTLFKASLAAGWLGTVWVLATSKSADKPLRILLITLAVLLGVLLAWLFSQGDAARLDDSAMRILWQLMKATFAGVVLLAGCVMVFKKRAGVVLLHAGVGLMMLSEVLVGTLAVETQMRLGEGETRNYVEDIRSLELAVIDGSDPDTDDVVAIPKSILLARKDDAYQRIEAETLPFDIEMVEFFRNSNLRQGAPDGDNPATDGAGLTNTVQELKPTSGTDSSGQVDLASAFVRFTEKQTGKEIGVYLVSLLLEPQPVTVGGKTYDVALRFKRTYKDYSVHLKDVRKNDYMGTTTPRDYRSVIRLVDETRGVELDSHDIWMNNPLRYAGETFYQSGYFLDERTGQESTTLAIVTNTGWMIPYVSCMIVAVGMLAHFAIMLVRFLNRRAAGVVAGPKLPDSRERSSFAERLFAVAVVLVVAVWLYGIAQPPSTPAGEFDLYAFGKLPVVHKGRVKPIDTLARNSLLVVSDRQTFTDDAGNRQPAIRWLMDMIADPEEGLKHKVFRIESLEVLDMLDLERRKGFRYAYSEFEDKRVELTKQAEAARKLDASQVSLLQRKILELEQKLGVLFVVAEAFSPPRIGDENPRDDLMRAISQQQMLARLDPPLVIPPADGADEDAKWETFSRGWTISLIERFRDNDPDPAVEAWTRMMVAYADDDAREFNKQVSEYQSELLADPPKGLQVSAEGRLGATDFEAYFNHFQPFFYATWLYVLAFVLVALSWLGWRGFNTAAFWLIVATLALHTFALVGRIYISGRPPVTNLYSSAVFIGWGAVVLGLMFEWVYKLGVGNVIAAVAGYSTLKIAEFLALEGDTFTVLQAVLDTQFWLATHVVCITLGYATTFVAGLLGVFYILRGVMTPTLTPAVGKDITRMVYGTLCFAIFFSFVGTVLGGLWADDSWGRFWGWDPKENGALIIVLWNALILHARWGGMVKERGLAALAVGGNIVTSWSWFGVNELGIGLHSYGFTEGVLMALGIWMLSQLAIIGLACLPKELWWSSQAQRASTSDSAVA